MRREEGGSTTVVVGWREVVELPDWGLRNIRAKVDTGARTSALHVENVRTSADGKSVTFHAVVHRGDEDHPEITTDIVRSTKVRSSTGESQERFVVATTMRIGSIEERIEISLVSRENMLCPMLVGRRALPPGVTVDPLRRYLHGRPKRRKKRRTS